MTGVAPGAVAWFEIGTTDAAATEAFYGQLFGWHFELDGDPAEGPAPGPAHGRILGAASQPIGAIDRLANGDTDGSAISILAVDVAAAVEQVERLGGTTVTPTTETADGAVVARVRDPQGNVVALVSATEAAAGPRPMPTAPATPGTFARFEIGSTDMDATRRFYEQAFGWGFESTGEGYYHDIYCPDAREVSGGLWDQSSGGRDYATFSILTDALSPTAARARKLGAHQLSPQSRTPDGVLATRLLDPAGAQFGLVAFPTEPETEADDADTDTERGG